MARDAANELSAMRESPASLGPSVRLAWITGPRSLVTILAATAVLMTGAALFGFTVPALISGVWMFALPVLAAWKTGEVGDRSAMVALVLVSMATRLLLGGVIAVLFEPALSAVFDDTQRYLQIGAQIADVWRAGSS